MCRAHESASWERARSSSAAAAAAAACTIDKKALAEDSKQYGVKFIYTQVDAEGQEPLYVLLKHDENTR